jgi:hypothetical protein
LGVKIRGEDKKKILLLSQICGKKDLMTDLISKPDLRRGLEEISELPVEGTTWISTGCNGKRGKTEQQKKDKKISPCNHVGHLLAP